MHGERSALSSRRRARAYTGYDVNPFPTPSDCGQTGSRSSATAFRPTVTLRQPRHFQSPPAQIHAYRTHRNNTKRMHWSAYALPISTSIRCNAVATNPQAHRSSGSRNLQRIRWAARTPEATAFCGHGSERGCAKMRAHRMGDAVAQQSAQGKTHEPRPSAKRSVATGRRVCSLDKPYNRL